MNVVFVTVMSKVPYSDSGSSKAVSQVLIQKHCSGGVAGKSS